MGSYTRYLALKALQAAITVWLTYSLTFIVVNLIPGDAVTAYLEAMNTATPEAIAELRRYYGHDQSWLVRYLSQLSSLLQGDFGYSLRLGKSVVLAVADAAASTFRLGALALGIALLLSLVLVLLVSASRAGSLLDRVVRAIPGICSAIPSFWIGLVALSVLGVQLQVMPIYPDGSLIAILVPASVLAIAVLPPIVEVALRRADSISQSLYVDLARVRGAGPLRIFFHHVLRNIANSVLVVAGLSLSMLLAGAVVTETIFSRTGIGVVLLEAVMSNDVPLVLGFVFIVAIAVTLISLVIDAVQPIIDPRLLREGAAT